MPTLLEKALAIDVERKRTNSVTEEQLELALAWLQGEVSLTQITLAMKGRSPQYRLAVWLKEAYNRGLIKVKS